MREGASRGGWIGGPHAHRCRRVQVPTPASAPRLPELQMEYSSRGHPQGWLCSPPVKGRWASRSTCPGAPARDSTQAALKVGLGVPAQRRKGSNPTPGILASAGLAQPVDRELYNKRGKKRENVNA